MNDYRCRPCGAPLGAAVKCEYCGCRNPDVATPHAWLNTNTQRIEMMSQAQHNRTLAQYQSEMLSRGMSNAWYGGLLGGILGR